MHNSASFPLILLKSFSGHLNIDPKQAAKNQDPSSSGSLDIVFTMFSYCYNNTVRITNEYFKEFVKKLTRSSTH